MNEASDSRRTPDLRHRGRAYTGFFSSARTTSLPLGSHVRPDELGGYHIDFARKPSKPSWPPRRLAEGADGDYLEVVSVQWVAQWGLGCFERYLNGEGEAWLGAALAVSEFLLRRQEGGGSHDGAWFNRRPMRHTFHLDAPWISAMAQGEGASLMVRVHSASGDERFAVAARRALNAMAVPTSEGGVRVPVGSGFLLEEYPTNPPSLVLNGAIFALWGYYDVAVGLHDGAARSEFDRGVDTLAAEIRRWDTGSWSRYDLFPFRTVNVASSAYHALHINQLRAMQRIAPHPELGAALERFEAYAGSPRKRATAFARKAMFRLLVPRNRLLGRRAPFSRPARSGREPAPTR